MSYARALAAVGSSPSGAYWAGRATLVRRPEDIAAYDRAFGTVFGGQVPAAPAVVARPVEVRLDIDEPDAPGDEGEPGPEAAEVRTMRWSATEVLRHRDLATCTPDELDEAHRLMADLRVHAALRRSRRRRPAPRAGAPRPAAHRAPVPPHRRRGGPARRHPARAAPRRLVVLVDVSGSMEPYAWALTRFAHAAVAARRRGQVEVFALGTRVTRITRELATYDPDLALRQAGGAVADWAGGTRLGDGLRRFNDRWGVRGLALGRGGGDPVRRLGPGRPRGPRHRAGPAAAGGPPAGVGQPAEGVARLRTAGPGHGGGLPHVDEFVEGHSVASLEALAEVVGR